MQPFHQVLSAVALTMLSASCFASAVVYTSSSSFLPNIAPNAYTENFNGLSNPSSPASFSGNGFSYTVSAPGDLYASGDFLSTSFPYDVLTINFTGKEVKAIGGNFFAVDLGDAFRTAAITLTLSDLTTVVFSPTSAADSYRGFISDVGITSMTISAGDVPFQELYAAIDNLTVGEIPEPASLSLVSLALVGAATTRRRNKA